MPKWPKPKDIEAVIRDHGDGDDWSLGPGMAAGFPAGKADGHHLVNRSAADVVYLEVGDRSAGDEGVYPDVDLAARLVDGKPVFSRKNGEPY